MVPQVTVIGILMIVNGALCVLYGVLLIFMGPFLSTMFDAQGAQMPPQAQPQMQQMQQMMRVVSIVYIVLGSAAALAGVMNIVGGIAALRFRSRTLVIVALFFNAAAFGTCYCVPTSLGLMIWGLIVMFQTDVARAFVLGTEGCSAQEIRDRFARPAYREREYDREDESQDRPQRREAAEEEPRERPPPPKHPGDEGFFEK